jgi:hypothetical protein
MHHHDPALVESLIFSSNHTLSHAALAAVYETLSISVRLPGSPEMEVDEESMKNKYKLELILRYAFFVTPTSRADRQQITPRLTCSETCLYAPSRLDSAVFHYSRS